MISLFDDQIDLRNATREAMKKYRRVLVQAETGSGKTVIGSSMLAGSREKGNTSMFVVPRRELLKQTARTLWRYNLPFSYVASGHQTNPFSKIYLATTRTLIKRLDKVPVPKLVFIDEAHFDGATNKRIIDYYVERGAWVIGLSATPQYPNGDGMGDAYDAMVKGPSLRWLIDNKRLSEYRAFAPSRPNLERVRIVDGDYAKGELADLMESDRVLIGDAVRQYRENAMGMLNVAYCTSRKHSNIVAQSFRDAGIPAAHVDSDTSDTEMLRILKAYARREILVLCNAMLLTFGFDLSAAVEMDITVESMSDLSPTMSITLQRQKNGRPIRYKEYPAIINDHSGNIMRHGLPCAEIDWTLAAKAEKKSRNPLLDDDEESGVAVKQCNGGHKDGPGSGDKMPPCHFSHPPAPRCPNCGAWYEIQGRMVKTVEGNLVELTRPEEFSLSMATPEQRAQIEEAVERMAKNAMATGIPRARAYEWAAKKVTEKIIKGYSHGKGRN